MRVRRVTYRIPWERSTTYAIIQLALAPVLISPTADRPAEPSAGPAVNRVAAQQSGTRAIGFVRRSAGRAAAHSQQFLIAAPSQPGKQLDGDYVTNNLDDAALLAWAQTVLT